MLFTIASSADKNENCDPWAYGLKSDSEILIQDMKSFEEVLVS